jgi:hypothetical protein
MTQQADASVIRRPVVNRPVAVTTTTARTGEDRPSFRRSQEARARRHREREIASWLRSLSR